MPCGECKWWDIESAIDELDGERIELSQTCAVCLFDIATVPNPPWALTCAETDRWMYATDGNACPQFTPREQEPK